MRTHWKPLRNVSARDIRVRNRGYLPHWEIPGATYSVTFRLHDSIPAAIAERLREEYQTSLHAIESRDATAVERSALLLQHALRVDHYLDQGYGACTLRKPEIARIVRDAILYFENDRYDLPAWCVMPNHVHLVMKPRDEWTLSKLMHSLKSYTSKEINKALGRAGQNWQDEYFDRVIRDLQDLERAIEYVRANPVKAGLRDWEWVSE